MKLKRTVPIAGATGYILLWHWEYPFRFYCQFFCFAVAHNQREKSSDRRGVLEGWTWRRKIPLSQRHYRGAIENGGDSGSIRKQNVATLGHS